MEDYQKRFAKILADSGVLFFSDGLLLKDGRPTPYLINTGKFKSGKMNLELGSCYASMLVRKNIVDGIDIIYGPSYKGSAIAVGTVNALWANYGLNKDFEYDRKEAKAHGESTQKESLLVNKTLFDGARIFIVDDVWTSGATKYESIEKIKREVESQDYDVKIVGVGIAIDREQVGPVYDNTKSEDLPNKERVILGERGENVIDSFVANTEIPVHSIMGITDAVNHLHGIGYPLMINNDKKPMDEKTFDDFNKYMETYGVER
jgi:orotate phosphoribosyltransferase